MKWVLAVFAVLLGACAAPPAVVAPESAGSTGAVLARDERRLIVLPGPQDSLAVIARRFLGDPARAWEIAEFNGVSEASPGQALVVPLVAVNPRGVGAELQLVPVLTYHRLGYKASRMTVTPEAFEAQLAYLQKNGYRVARLADLAEFLQGRRALPRKTVVITFDDGHGSAWQYAYPLLRKYGVPATFFLYTDILGGGDALRWEQIREMSRSGLADFQLHSKSHANLVLRLPGESDKDYRSRLDGEIRSPRDVLTRQLGAAPAYYAYPFGDANALVVERLQAAGQSLGLTVNPGGNAFYAYPFMLRRTMIFGEYDLKAFDAALQTTRSLGGK